MNGSSVVLCKARDQWVYKLEKNNHILDANVMYLDIQLFSSSFVHAVLVGTFVPSALARLGLFLNRKHQCSSGSPVHFIGDMQFIVSA